VQEPSEYSKDPAQLAKALEVISSISRHLPSTAPAPENLRSPGYDAPQVADEGVRLSDVWTAISKRRWLVVSIVLLVTITTAVFLARKPDIYLAEAGVQVDTEIASGFGKNNPIILNAGEDPTYFNTQLQVLTKPGLLRRVVKTLDLEHNQDFLRADAGDRSTTWQRLLRTFGLAGPAPQTDNQKPDSGKLLVRELASPTLRDDLEEAARLDRYVSSIQGGLKVEPVKEERLAITDTRLISIKFTHPNPVVAAKVVNAIAETFVLSNLEQKTESTSSTSTFLQRRVAELQNQIHNDQERLLNYAHDHEILALDASQNTVVDRLSGLNKELLQAENERKIAEAAYRVSKEPGAAEALPGGATKDLETKLNELKEKRAQLLVENTEEWPEVKEVENEIAELEKQIKEAHSKGISTESKTLEMRYHEALDHEQKLRAAFEQQRAATRTQNEAAINYRIIEQEVQTNKGLLDELLQRSKENDVLLAGTPNNIHVTDYAIAPQAPIGPKRLQGIMLAFVFSLGFGVALATVLEYLDDSVRSTEDVGRLRLPALAVIPRVGVGSAPRRLLSSEGRKSLQLLKVNGRPSPRPELLLDADQRSPLAESYRQLRTSVLLSSPGRAPQTLLVTSCMAAEGKTTIAVNLAASLAQTGARVLIIDADMRRPRIHSVFGVENRRGLCTILASGLSEAETLACVQKEATSGVYVLPSGPVPPNPAELIGSEQMRSLLTLLKAKFDHIIIDSPPITSFTDGVLAAAVSDGVILVIHANQYSRKIVLRSRQRLEEVGAKLLGVVLNRINARSPDYYYYGYGYYYYRRYKYGDQPEEDSRPAA
jgi:capsular exopolysaccharide synthesis family protein